MEHCADIHPTACLNEVSAFPDIPVLSRRRASEPGPSKVSEELLHSSFLSTFSHGERGEDKEDEGTSASLTIVGEPVPQARSSKRREAVVTGFKSEDF